MVRMLSLALLAMFLTTAYPKIMRNNALMTKMVSQFQGKDNSRTREQKAENIPPTEEVKPEEDGSPSKVLSLMQNVLCKNFPSVPCKIITKDETLRNLIEKSIQQLRYKKMTMEKSTSPPNNQLTLFPVMNNEELSNFLQVSNTGSFKHKKMRTEKERNRRRNRQEKNHWSQENRNKTRTAVINGRKKIRKFYPHKYKDKGDKNFHDYSDEKLSMSVETPHDHSPNIKRKHFSFRGNPSDPPVWRIDYMKHGEPSLNMFGYESDSLKGKIIKSGPNVIVDDNILEQSPRRDVLHPDMYIKNNYSRKITTDSSDATE